MKRNLNFNISNRALLAEEMGIVDIVNESLHASANKHGFSLKKDIAIAPKITTRNGKTIRRVSAQGKDPIEVLLVTS